MHQSHPASWWLGQHSKPSLQKRMTGTRIAFSLGGEEAAFRTPVHRHVSKRSGVDPVTRVRTPKLAALTGTAGGCVAALDPRDTPTWHFIEMDNGKRKLAKKKKRAPKGKIDNVGSEI